MSKLTDLIRSTKEFTDLLAAAGPARRGARVRLTGLSGSQKAFALSALAEAEGGLAVMTFNQTEADRLASDMRAFLGGMLPVYEFPFKDLLPYEEAAAPIELTARRIAALSGLSRRAPGVYVFAARSASYRLMPPEDFLPLHITLKPGMSVDPLEVMGKLTHLGYERVDRCEAEAQASFKGGVLDIFPAGAELAVRAEFFGDDIESLRSFDPETQRSTGRLPEAVIAPAREMCVDAARLDDGIEKIAMALDKARQDAEGFEDPKARLASVERLAERVGRHIQKLREHGRFDNDEQYIGYFFGKPASILDYIGDTLLVADEPERAHNSLRGYDRDASETYASFAEQGLVLPGNMGAHLGAGYVEMRAQGARRIELTAAPAQEEGPFEAVEVMMSMREPSFKSGDFPGMVKEADKSRRKGFAVVVAASTAERAERLRAAFLDEGAPVLRQDWDRLEPARGTIRVTVADISSGFISNPARLVLLTDTEFFGAAKKRKSYRQFAEGSKISSYKDLSPGDFVVHRDHGIGRYLDMKPMESLGVIRDYMSVEYAGGSMVYIPVEQVSVLQKYIGSEDSAPKLNKLGGIEWAKARTRAGKAVMEIAEELVRLYAARLSVSAKPCGPDGPWQAAFEDRFPYDETEDQMEAVRAAKLDLEKDHPMDRLVCGDVGFGKTEVALRAAFKVAAEGRQVAVLAPTTILSYQHFNTFKERFEGFPVRVALLSRLTKPEEEKKILKELESGLVDIAVGTHRLLSKDVKFRDLGLLVVDEEQRFGVEQKERLKMMRTDVHVLTLTATPIPRTMHMSMVGARDMSLIGTPPENRFPIRTYVTEHDDKMLREAILREIDRGGQVFYVHNRVRNINMVAEELAGLVPEARIDVAHGQMNEERLEGLIMSFLRHEFDVLVCTTIIEAGIDMPNVNTLIVNDSERFGLAQLYQLRGRVGRSSRVAYAYLTYKRDNILSEAADKRLAAIREFSNLGSGYRIAMRDLEIRGAGNLLGHEQSGHISSVGFEMYSAMLEEAVRELKGEQPAYVPAPITIDLPFSAYIPSSYIPDQAEKIEAYRKVNAVLIRQDALELAEELADRFGRLPKEVANLIAVAEIKAMAREVDVASIGIEAEDRSGEAMIAVRFAEGKSFQNLADGERITRLFPGLMPVPVSRTAPLLMRYRELDAPAIADNLRRLMGEIARTRLRDRIFHDRLEAGERLEIAASKAIAESGIVIPEGMPEDRGQRKQRQGPPPRPIRYDEEPMRPIGQVKPPELYNRKLAIAGKRPSDKDASGKKEGK